MNDLEKIINQNQESFNTEEPLDGHFERFQNKLNNSKSKVKKLNPSLIIKIAAVILISFVSTTWIYNNYIFDKPTQKMEIAEGIKLSQVSPEYKEVEDYYSDYVNIRLSELYKLKCEKSEISKEPIFEEINELDMVYISLQEELKHNSSDERIINAMIMNYRNKVDFLYYVINRLKSNC